jgi:hypothetical protein
MEITGGGCRILWARRFHGENRELIVNTEKDPQNDDLRSGPPRLPKIWERLFRRPAFVAPGNPRLQDSPVGTQVGPPDSWSGLSAVELGPFATMTIRRSSPHWGELFALRKGSKCSRRGYPWHVGMDTSRPPDIPAPQPYTSEIHRILLHGLFATNSWIAIHMIVDLLEPKGGLTSRRNLIPIDSSHLSPIQEWECTVHP